MSFLSVMFAQHFASLPSNFWTLAIPFGLLELVLLIFALVDVVRREPERVRGSKLAWILIIIFINTLGPICYFILGRKEV